LSALWLLAMVLGAWLVLRKVIPAPEIWRLPVAVLLLGIGFAAWWPAAAGPFARGKSPRDFGMVDLLPLAFVILGGMILLAALLGWGARPLESAADKVSDLVWGDPDAGNEKPPPEKPEENPRPGGEGDILASWQSRSLPDGSDGPGLPDAPPLLLTFERAEDVAYWKTRTVYVRVAALEVVGSFGGNWRPLPVIPEVLEDPADGLADGFVTNPESPRGEHPSAGWSIFVPQDTSIVPSLLGMEKLRAESVTREGAAIWLLDAPTGGFAGSSRPLVAGHGHPVLPENPVFPARSADDPLLALPKDRVGDLARAMAADFDRNLSFRDLVASVPVWLARRCTYSEEYPNPNQLPPLIHFLEIGRTGICEHFAASGVLLFRALGIPSRLAYGYAGGSLAEASRMITYGAKDFHAWAEIHVPGLGWVAVECTPPGAGAARPPEQAEETAPEPPPPPEEQEQNQPPDWRLWAAMAGAAFLLFLLAWLSARWRSRARARGQTGGGEPALPQPAWFQAFLDASTRLGVPRRRGRTAREHLEFLRRARIADDGIEELIEEYHFIRYDGRADDRAEEMEAIVARWFDRHQEMIRDKRDGAR
jgi:transglutaminase-like putative cysteine protease